MEQKHELSQNVTFFKTLLNAIPDMLFHLDKKGTFLSSFQGDNRDLALPVGQYNGKNVREIFGGKLAEQIIEAIGHTLKYGSYEHQYELVFEKLNYVTATYSKVNDNEVISLVRNITAQKESELALKDSEARYRNLIENLNEVVYELDESGIVRYISPSVQKITGYTPEEVKGKSIHHFIGEKEAFLAKRIKLLIKKKALQSEYRIWKKSGEDCWIRLSSQAIFRDGKLTGVSGTLTDITQYAVMQRALSESEERYRKVIEQTLTMVWDVDRNGLFTFVSPVAQSVWGYDPDDLTEKLCFYDLHPEKSREEIKKVIFDAMSRREILTDFVSNIVCRDGRIITVSTNGLPLYDDQNQLTGFRGYDVDITNQIKAGEEIRRKENMLRANAASTDEFLSNPDYLEAIAKSLPVIGKAVDVDRVYVFQNTFSNGSNGVTSQRMEWNSGSVRPQINNPVLQNVPLEIFDTFLEELYQKKPFRSVVRLLPDESGIKGILKAQDIQSVLIIPVFCKDLFWGFVGYDECRYERIWGEDEISILKSFCNSIAIVIERAQVNEELRNMALFAQENPDPLFRTDRKGKIILSNKTAETLYQIKLNNELYSFPEFARKAAVDVTPGNPLKEYEVESNGKTYRIVSLISQNQIHINIYTHNITELKKTQRELERLSLVSSTNRLGVHFTMPDFKITYANEALLRMTGYTKDEVLGKTPMELFDGPLTQAGVVINGHLNGIQVDTDVIIYRKDKTCFWSNIKMQPPGKGDPEQREYFAVIEDVSEKKKAEEVLRNSESRLSTLIQNLNEGILLEDQYRRIVFSNTNFCKLFNIPASPEMMKGADCSRSADESKHFFKNPDQFVERIDAILKAKKPVYAEELELVNGQFYERDYIPVFIDSVYKGHLWKYVDITSRKNYERNLELQEEKYRNIIANMSMGLVEVDLNDVIQYVNQQFCKMSGYTSAELPGRMLTELLIADGFRELVREKSQLRMAGISDVYQVQVLTKAGDVRWWLISGAPNYNDEGQIIGIVGISVDVTEQKQLENELQKARLKAEESSRAKELFLANMSHEIRTPLSAIIGLIREISGGPLSPRQAEFLKNLDVAGQHLLSIVNDILDLTKIEAGQLTLESHPFNLHEVIGNAVTLLTPAAVEKKLRIDTTVSQEVAPAYAGDSIRIRQILINLINNAIKFTEKGSVGIECKVAGSDRDLHTLLLSVTDTGIGIEESYLEKIFEKFSQADMSTGRKYGGTGLGMAIVHELVQLMKGTITVRSRKNAGTTVEVILTLQVSKEKESKTTITPESLEKLKHVRILLVEDNDLNRLVACNTLSYYGVLVTEAVNGFEAIEKLKKSDFDVILMDIQMPEMDGIEATKFIRNELNSTIPIIALSANAFKSEMDLCTEAGMNDYITKPYEESLLLSAVLKNLTEISCSVTSAEIPDRIKKHYSLTNLNTMSHGDRVFVREMITLFINQIPLDVEKIKTARNNNDPETIWKVAHRIKPTFINMGIEDLTEDIRTIESLARQNRITPELDQLIDRMDRIIQMVVTELNEELNH